MSSYVYPQTDSQGDTLTNAPKNDQFLLNIQG